jgi:hypothetical protein
MTPTVFFSWQSDSPNETNRRFIRSALEEAVNGVAVIDEPVRVDAATEGVSGTPEIASTIFEKLTETAVAVFDVTPIGRVTGKKKVLPNPNVLLELGFASATIGWKRIILVFNADLGYEVEDLPFDLRHRLFPIRYWAKIGNEKKQRTKLASNLKDYISDALKQTHLEVESAKRKLSIGCIHLIASFGKSRFFSYHAEQNASDVLRLIDLGLLRFDFDPANLKYAYHWTYLGDEVCNWFHKNRPAPESTAPKLIKLRT